MYIPRKWQRASFDRWSGSGVSWCYFEVLCNHHLLQPQKAVRDAIELVPEKVKIGMDAFSTLLS